MRDKHRDIERDGRVTSRGRTPAPENKDEELNRPTDRTAARNARISARPTRRPRGDR